MAGRFTGLCYDQDTYNEQLSRSTDPMHYRLDRNFAVNCDACFAPNGPRGGRDTIETFADRIDVDSVLRGIDKPCGKSTRHQAPTPLNCHSNTPVENDAISTEYSRYTHPAYDIKGLNVPDMRFDYPLFDPQCQIFENFEVNTRLNAKDNHKAIWQTPLDQTNSLPKERYGKAAKCTVSINCDYAPWDG